MDIESKAQINPFNSYKNIPNFFTDNVFRTENRNKHEGLLKCLVVWNQWNSLVDGRNAGHVAVGADAVLDEVLLDLPGLQARLVVLVHRDRPGHRGQHLLGPRSPNLLRPHRAGFSPPELSKLHNIVYA